MSYYGPAYDDCMTPFYYAVTSLLQNFEQLPAGVLGTTFYPEEMHAYLTETIDMYNKALEEKEMEEKLLKEAQAKLQEIEDTARRCQNIQDPVVASDGCTYGRQALVEYIKNCDGKAYSEKTKEELKPDVLIPNNSLSNIVSKIIEYCEESKKGSGGAPRPRMATHDGMAMPVPLGAHGGDMMGGGGNGGGGPHHRGGNPRFGGGRGGGGGGRGGHTPELHPCLRVYGHCNFADCTFANYPYSACLNHIKGKCRYGDSCKEVHVDPNDPAFQNLRSSAHPLNQQHGGKAGKDNSHGNNTGSETQGKDKDKSSGKANNGETAAADVDKGQAEE